jgi:hypothetical protein
MVIKPSSAAEIKQLIAALGSADETAREAAVARLAVIGARAAEHLLRDAAAAPAGRAKAGMFQALEAIADPRAAKPARAALDDAGGDVATMLAAISLLRSLLTTAETPAARDAFDGLVTVTLDRRRAADVRLAALDALEELPSSLVDPVRHALADDPDAAVRSRGAAAERGAREPVWKAAVEGRLPAAPDALKRALARQASSASLTELQHVIDAVRMRETRTPDEERRAQWQMVRGLAHQALAARGSRIALYDLRDSLTQTERLAVAFLAALEEVGDATCLEPLAAAYAASSRSGDAWWREHVATAFRAIVHREGLTRRHAALKRVLSRWPEAAADLMARS